MKMIFHRILCNIYMLVYIYFSIQCYKYENINNLIISSFVNINTKMILERR